MSQGIALGEPIPTLAKRLQTASKVSKRQATTVVRTAVNHVVTNAREETYKENSDVIKGVQFVATLDERTSYICIALDGRVFDIGEGPRPPTHHQCRSTTVPVVKSLKELGLSDKEFPASTRASMNGQAADTTVYPEWLKKQSVETQNAVLGKKRGELFRSGKLDLRKFSCNSPCDANASKTLKELENFKLKPVETDIKSKPKYAKTEAQKYAKSMAEGGKTFTPTFAETISQTNKTATNVSSGISGVLQSKATNIDEAKTLLQEVLQAKKDHPELKAALIDKQKGLKKFLKEQYADKIKSANSLKEAKAIYKETIPLGYNKQAKDYLKSLFPGQGAPPPAPIPTPKVGITAKKEPVFKPPSKYPARNTSRPTLPKSKSQTYEKPNVLQGEAYEAAHKKWIASLDDEERFAFEEWFLNWGDMRNADRFDVPNRQLGIMKKALARAPRTDETVYRTIQVSSQEAKAIATGTKRFDNLAMSSYTRDLKVVEDLEKAAPQGRKNIRIKAKVSSVRLDELNPAGTAENLVSKKVKLRVTKVTGDGFGGYELEVEEFIPKRRKNARFNRDEKDSIRKFTGSFSGQIRKAQRMGATEPYLEELIEGMEDAYDKRPLYEGTVYRGMRGLDDEALKLWTTEGSSFELNSWHSFSKSEVMARNFSGHSGWTFEIKTKQGFDIEDVSSFVSEREVLLPRGGKVRVKHSNEKLRYVILEEI
jgi:SPP1 gp7 family putative phage head morphogenesis protein